MSVIGTATATALLIVRIDRNLLIGLFVLLAIVEGLLGRLLTGRGVTLLDGTDDVLAGRILLSI